MIKLLTRECERHSKYLTSSISNMEQLKSTCSATTYVKIKDFLQATSNDLRDVLESKRNRKRAFTGKKASCELLSTRHNNKTSRQHNQSHEHVTNTNNLSHSQITTSIEGNTNNQPVTNTIVPPTHTRTHRRRRKRKSTNRNTTKYWRRKNHNTQLDTNAVINLSNRTLTHDETQVLARGLSFCPTPHNINWTEVKADLNKLSRRMRLLEYFHDFPPQAKTNLCCNKGTWTPPPYRDPALDTSVLRRSRT